MSISKYYGVLDGHNESRSMGGSIESQFPDTDSVREAFWMVGMREITGKLRSKRNLGVIRPKNPGFTMHDADCIRAGCPLRHATGWTPFLN